MTTPDTRSNSDLLDFWWMKTLFGAIALISVGLVALGVYTLLPVAPALPVDTVNPVYAVSALAFLLLLIGSGLLTTRVATRRVRPS